MSLRFVGVLCLSALVGYSYSEPSAFGDVGNGGYVASGTELRKQAEEILQLKGRLLELSQKLSVALERQEGIKSILEGYGQTMTRLEESMAKSTDTQARTALADLNATVARLSAQMELEHTNIERTAQAVRDLATEIQKIGAETNVTRVTPAQLEDLAAAIEELRVERLRRDYVDLLAKRDAYSKQMMRKRDPLKLLDEAIKDFERGELWSVEPVFEYLAQNKPTKAEALFYRGEIRLAQERYEEALTFYKESVGVQSEGRWVSRLLLHTGVALEKIGDTVGAVRVYEILTGSYGASREALAAKKALRKLKK